MAIEKPDGWLSNVKKHGHGCEKQTVETISQSFEEYWMMGCAYVKVGPDPTTNLWWHKFYDSSGLAKCFYRGRMVGNI